MKPLLAPRPYVVLVALLALIAASFGRLGEAAQERRIGLIEALPRQRVLIGYQFGRECHFGVEGSPISKLYSSREKKSGTKSERRGSK